MTDTPDTPETIAVPDKMAGANSKRAKTKARSRPAGKETLAVLERLAALYPHLFGAVFLPLKRGIFQDLIDAHPGLFTRDALKAALAQHTRSGRYLVAVAEGRQRHDLAGKEVEAMAPEHVHHALLEVFKRRQSRTQEDLRPTLQRRMAQAFRRSGLAPDAYAELVHSRDQATNQLLAEALSDARASGAKDEALLRAFEAGAHGVEAFAEMYGMEARSAGQALERARRARAAAAAAVVSSLASDSSDVSQATGSQVATGPGTDADSDSVSDSDSDSDSEVDAGVDAGPDAAAEPPARD